MSQDLHPIEVPRGVPALLGFVAGYVDSCTFLALFGEFVAQVTGSFVLAGTQLVKHETGAIAKLMAIPVFFLAGFAVTMLAHLMARRGRSALTASLATECALLVGFLATLAAGTPLRGPDAPLALAAAAFGIAAMGVQSALVRLLMRGVASTNVMTTNTTQFAIDSAELLLEWRAHRRGGGQGAGALPRGAAAGRDPDADRALLLPRHRARRRGVCDARVARASCCRSRSWRRSRPGRACGGLFPFGARIADGAGKGPPAGRDARRSGAAAANTADAGAGRCVGDGATFALPAVLRLCGECPVINFAGKAGALTDER